MHGHIVGVQSAAALLEAPEPVFRLSSSCKLQDIDDDDAMASHLARRISAHPGHLQLSASDAEPWMPVKALLGLG